MVARGKTRSVPTEALVQFIAGGFLGQLMWWLDGKMRPSVEEVGSMFRRLAIPSVKAALRLYLTFRESSKNQEVDLRMESFKIMHRIADR